MTWLELLAAVALAAYFIWKLSSLAGRLDVIHRRIDRTLYSLDLQLGWRSQCVSELLRHGFFSGNSAAAASQLLEDLALAEPKSQSEYLAVESSLTQFLVGYFNEDFQVAPIDTNTGQWLRDLAAASRRLELARRFHNDAVGAAHLLRGRSLVRWFRLAGHTAWPRAIDLDDTVPPALESLV